ncbi:uncharacterized protein LOC121378153 [Gigantopelta aegis]|uniref:uncharacterized protein LOC121378153 n=1 Tax=Gigantopelta aegis TaxID=1735272 RepID=UPI001B88A5EF|nr:uncharacterized protein LOC121378153 [Gigantopelta aegis]
MPFWFGLDHRTIILSTYALTAGVAVYSTFRLLQQRKAKRRDNVYESDKLLSEYLVFHYGSPEQFLKYDLGPKSSLEFPKRCAELCIKHYRTDPKIPSRALDIGCAVGRSTFELSRKLDEIIGIDYSYSFVETCDYLKVTGEMHYSVTDEGDLRSQLTARVHPDINRDVVTFQQGDACNLPESLGQFGVVLAANLICRLHDPLAFLNSLPRLVASGGILIITAPYTWQEEYCDKNKWLGGYKNRNGEAVTGFSTLKKILSPTFDLVEDLDMPFFIRETARKNQWTVAHATVWRRK